MSRTMIACCNKDDNKWSLSEKKMEGSISDDGLRTVECLRGRLLAERQASRTANQDAEFMGNKLIEIENRLKEETKLRNKAEKRLKLLRKKLELLNIILPSNLEECSDQQSSSNCSSVSSSSSSATKHTQEESANSKSQNDLLAPQISEKAEENASDTTHEEKHSNSPVSTTQSDQSSPKIENSSSSSLKASTVDEDEDEDDDFDFDFVDDNSLALVPLNLPEAKLAPEQVKIVSKSVGEMLDTLRHARERIQSSMQGRRQMIRVGPS